MHPERSKRLVAFLKKASVVLRNKYFITSAFVLVCLVTLLLTSLLLKTYVVRTDNGVNTVVTYEPDAFRVMDTLGVDIMPGDKLTVTKTPSSDIVLDLKRSFMVSVCADGAYVYRTVLGGTVKDLLDELGIKLTEHDYVNQPLDAPLTEGMHIKVSRVEYRVYTEEIAIKHTDSVLPMLFSYSYSRYAPKNRAGKDGLKRLVKQEYIVDGVVEKVETISETVIREPTSGVVYSDVRHLLNLGSGKPKKYDRVLTATATAYTYHSSGGNYTATGSRVRVGAVAVDPKVIKLGSKLYIETVDGKFTYGYCTALDTGGAIKGNRVDLFLPSKKDVYNFGRRSVRVYVLS